MKTETGINIQTGLIQLLFFWLLLGLTCPTLANEVTQKYKGLTLNANLEMAEGKDFKDGVVLIVHGLQAHNRMEIIESSQQVMVDNGQSSLAINLGLGINNRRGFYECSWPHRHGFNNAADEIHAWVNWLKQQDSGKIVLMAHSLGGTQALVYSSKFPKDKIDSLILLAPATAGYDRLKKDYRLRYDKSLDDVLERANKMIESGKGKQLMQNTDFFYCPKADVAAETFNDYYRKDSAFSQTPDFVQRLKIPILIIAGSEDERQPDVIRHLLPLADGKKIQLKVIESAGHFFRDLNIEEAIELAVEFIQN